METFRQAMAFPLLATVAWLVWVFGRQTGDDGVLRLLGALVLGSFAAWLEGRFARGRGRAAAAMLTGICLAAGLFLVVSASSRSDAAPVVAAADGVAWVAWDPDAVTQHRSAGRPVFVDFTADWCLSCKVNERVALAGPDFAELIRSHSAVAMRADWTRADPRITETLTAFGRSGVPLYVVYPGDPGRDPIVLPQILTPAVVREALQRAVT
jgi:thiol:disulfide interchange protein DsbD